jgi:SAM-dependent methyltransferase
MAPASAEVTMSSGDLTTPKDWDRAHAGQLFTYEQVANFPQFPWMDPMLDLLRHFEGGRFLELGCSPGQISAMIATRLKFRFEGVDFSDSAWLYNRNMETAGVKDAVLHSSDVRTYQPAELFDVVGSFGLVEHFDDPQEILDHHDRLLRPGGLCVVELPRFKGFPWLFKWVFDRPNLRKHNTRMMVTRTFEEFARRRRHEVLFLGMVGGPQVWGCDDGHPEWVRNLSLAIKGWVKTTLNPRVRPAHPWFAPWMLYVGRKP